jgi:putative SOS response-associated peptidase YedK
MIAGLPPTPRSISCALLKPRPAERMRTIAVNRSVNSVKNDDETCIDPIGEPPLAV